MKWANTQPTFHRPTRWVGGKYDEATGNAAREITNNTDLDWIRTHSTTWSAQWGSFDYGSFGGRDGFAEWSYTYGTGFCHLTPGTVKLRYNEYYTNAYAVDKLQSVGIHEFGHGYGHGHVGDDRLCGTTSPEVSYMQPYTGCRFDTLGIYRMTPDDQSAINNTY